GRRPARGPTWTRAGRRAAPGRHRSAPPLWTWTSRTSWPARRRAAPRPGRRERRSGVRPASWLADRPGSPGPVQADAAQGEQDEQDATAGNGGVGQVEHGPVAGQLDPVDDVSAKGPRRAEDPVDEVAGRAAEQQAEADRPADAPQVPGGAQDVDDHAGGDGGEHDRDRGAAEVERRAPVAHL